MSTARRREAAAPSYGFATERGIAAIFDGSQAKELGVLSFFGVWNLEFGVSKRSITH
jgi:hypothetical protein